MPVRLTERWVTASLIPDILNVPRPARPLDTLNVSVHKETKRKEQMTARVNEWMKEWRGNEWMEVAADSRPVTLCGQRGNHRWYATAVLSVLELLLCRNVITLQTVTFIYLYRTVKGTEGGRLGYRGRHSTALKGWRGGRTHTPHLLSLICHTRHLSALNPIRIAATHTLWAGLAQR